ncbi:hypothetical protein F4823DRAFT_150858 [Ustulina deusta]|nr:hypothetical protein F4823DRAFT_150858 [Ustulina deusta]
MASNDWERHKATILTLFLHDNTPLHQVASYMEKTHNFTKTTSTNSGNSALRKRCLKKPGNMSVIKSRKEKCLVLNYPPGSSFAPRRLLSSNQMFRGQKFFPGFISKTVCCLHQAFPTIC